MSDLASRLRTRAQQVLDFVFKVEGAPGLVSIPRSVNDVDALFCEAADEIARLRGALAVIASGKTPPDKSGHYLAHRSAVRLARRTLGQEGSEVGDELAREGSVSGMNPKGGPA